MKLSVAIIALFASIAFAQTPSLNELGFPKCAQACINEGNQKAGCTGADPRCGCGKAANDAVAACFAKNTPCTPEDAAKSQQAGEKACAPINGPAPTSKNQASNSTAAKTSNAGSLDKATTGLMGLIGAAAILAV